MFAALNSFLTRAVSGYFLNKSLRFRSSASAYLNRTVSAAVSTYTVSMWVKRGTLTSTYQYLFSHLNSGNTDGYGLAFNITTDTLYYYNGTVQATTAAYRDPAAWYHIVFSNNAGSFTIYVNGVSVKTGTATAIPSGAVMNLGRYGFSSTFYFDGELAEINFVDGQALAPTAFGASSIYNQWLPIKYAGTYGTNGFYLPFTNTASTSTLVADSSGNANNWTPNNISLTAGSTYDSLTDVPTLTSETVANYAVLNPLGNVVGTQVPLSNGNLTSSGEGWANSTISLLAPGKFYFEYKLSAIAGTPYLGLGSIFADVTAYVNDGRIFVNGSVVTTVATYTTGDVIACAYDTAGTVTFYKNNTSVYSGSYAYRANLFFLVYINYSTASVNFGQQPFTYPAPTGFLPLNTYNI